MEQGDRRQFQRRPFDSEVLCYIDGNRLDSRTADISTGGLFLHTQRYQNFPAGAIVGLVFEDTGVPPGTAFLFARVVRHQETPRPGVGLHWERAVCAGSPLPLKRVVNRLFGFEDIDVASREIAERGLTQYVFRFPPSPDSVVAQAGSPSSMARPKEPPPAVRTPEPPPALELDRSETRTQARAPIAIPRDAPCGDSPIPAPPGKEPDAGAGHRGPLTGQIDTRGARQALDVPAVLEALGVPIPIRLRWIGVGAAGVDCPWVPVDPDIPMLLKFEIQTREGAAQIKCNARLRSSDLGKGGRTPALELTIKDIDEGGRSGLLVRYLKWLAFRQLAND